MKGWRRVRLELILHNRRHHILALSNSWWCDNYGRNSPTIHTKIVCFGLIQESQSISTLPMSQYKYNELLEEIEIVVWALKWSPPHVL